MSDVLNVAVVGAGYWGRNLVRNFAAVRRCALKYVCDLNPEVLAAHRRSFPFVEITPDATAVLDDPQVQAIVIATPAATHFEIASQALRAGKHVYVEKPLTLQAAQARQLIELAAKAKRKLMVGHLLEYHPAVTYLKEMLDRGRLGEPYYLYTQRVNLGIVRQNENAWWSLAPHDLLSAGFRAGVGRGQRAVLPAEGYRGRCLRDDQVRRRQDGARPLQLAGPAQDS